MTPDPAQTARLPARRGEPPLLPDDAVTAAAAAIPRPRQGPTLTLWASTPGGCEVQAAAELAALGWQPAAVPTPPRAQAGWAHGLVWERGSVYGRADVASVLATLRAARTITRVTLLVQATRITTLDDVFATVRHADLPDLPDAPFAVVAERTGRHSFRSPDVARVAGDAVNARHRAATGRRLPVDLEHPTTVVRVEVTEERLRVGCELTAGSLHRRAYYAARHHAGVSPAVAAMLLGHAGWRAHERLVDPFCGAGTIAVEATLAALRHPPRGPGVPDRLAPLGLADDRARAAVDAAIAAARRPTPTTTPTTASSTPPATAPTPLAVRAREREVAHVRQAWANLAAAGLADAASARPGGAIDLDRGDARRADAYGTACDRVVTNPPYGLRAGWRLQLRDLYREALAATAARLAPGGCAVWLITAPRVAAAAAEPHGLVLTSRRAIGLGSFDAFACRFEHAQP